MDDLCQCRLPKQNIRWGSALDCHHAPHLRGGASTVKSNAQMSSPSYTSELNCHLVTPTYLHINHSCSTLNHNKHFSSSIQIKYTRKDDFLRLLHGHQANFRRHCKERQPILRTFVLDPLLLKSLNSSIDYNIFEVISLGCESSANLGDTGNLLGTRRQRW
jgi:hypothetical protein